MIYAQVEVLTNKLCIPRTRPPTSTLALIPFYSGLSRDGARKDGIDSEDLPNTGNAHSMSSGATKLKTLRAVLCSALLFCKAALVGVCTSRDYESITKLLGTLPAGQARAVLLKSCYQKILPVMGRFVVFSSTDFTYHGHPQPQTSPKDRLRRSIALYYFTNGRPAKECLDGDCAGNDHSTLFKKPINCKVCEEATCKRYDETAPYWVDA